MAHASQMNVTSRANIAAAELPQSGAHSTSVSVPHVDGSANVRVAT
jgi:hypothetical protein